MNTTVIKSNKQRMINNLPHICDKELDRDDFLCQKKLYKYNKMPPQKLYGKKGKTLIKNILGKTGEKIVIKPPFRCSYGYQIEVGENFFANYGLTILDSGKVTIGNNVFIAPNVSIYTNTHPIHYKARNEGWDIGIDIRIGNNVWIGGNTIILPGVSIGDGCVIGAGSVVTKNLPPEVIAVGNPCKIVRKITEKDSLYYFKDLMFGTAHQIIR